jgi:hypothetical protein
VDVPLPTTTKSTTTESAGRLDFIHMANYKAALDVNLTIPPIKIAPL